MDVILTSTAQLILYGMTKSNVVNGKAPPVPAAMAMEVAAMGVKTTTAAAMKEVATKVEMAAILDPVYPLVRT